MLMPYVDINEPIKLHVGLMWHKIGIMKFINMNEKSISNEMLGDNY